MTFENPFPDPQPPPPVEVSASNPSPHSRLLPLYMSLAFIGTLAIGLVLGFMARPLVIPDQVRLVEIVPTPVPGEAESVAQADPPSQTETRPNSSSESDTGSESDAPGIMDFLLADARHSIGAADAPVVIIEFSDFR